MFGIFNRQSRTAARKSVPLAADWVDGIGFTGRMPADARIYYLDGGLMHVSALSGAHPAGGVRRYRGL